MSCNWTALLAADAVALIVAALAVLVFGLRRPRA
jgi:hypothetical protein